MEINFKDVSLVYNSNNKKALDKVNFHFDDSKITCITGKSGSGKTTIGYLTDMIYLPTSGEIDIDDFTISGYKIPRKINKLRADIGLVFENPDDQFFSSTVEKEIAIGMDYFKRKLTNKRKHISESLKIVGLDDSYLDKDPFTLSSGEKRLVAIACILAFNPKVIILDNPTKGLDYKRQKELIKLLKMLKRKYSKTIIIFSKNVDFINQVADNLYVLDNGKVVLNGSTEEIFNSKKYKELGLEIPKIVEFQNLVRTAKKVKMIYRTEMNDLIKEIYRVK